MKILTIGETPHLLTRNARINRDLLLSLKKQGHECHSLVYAHDISYFLPTETGAHNFDNGGETIAQLHPYFGERGAFPQFSLAMMKRIMPQIVISVGCYHDSTEIWPVKATYPSLFKWIAVLPEGTTVVNENYKEQIEYADLVVATSESSAAAFRKLCASPIEYVPYGPDLTVFKPLDIVPDDFGAITVGRNDQMSNLGAFIRATAMVEGMEGYIHTNIDDAGENDLRLLLRRYGCEDRVGVPSQKFISVREGVADTFMNELYNRYHVVVDCSMQSATALTMLEAMATGCVPIGMDFGAVGEVIRRMPEDFRVVVPHNVFVGPRGEEYAILAESGLADALERVRKRYQTSKEWFAEGRQKAIEVANFFQKDVFIERLNRIVEDAIDCEHAIVVDSL